ncbi:MAG: hypothetical protein WDO13_15905 [Verrucomicrobiota bacterium]
MSTTVMSIGRGENHSTSHWSWTVKVVVAVLTWVPSNFCTTCAAPWPRAVPPTAAQAINARRRRTAHP